MRQPLLVDATTLKEQVAEGSVRVFDCRFDLAHRRRGRDSWLASHIPGAAYADLDQNLAGRVTARSGRHPLPQQRSFAAFLARSGWRAGLPIVAYDAQGGAFAARLWWLMRYFGHDCVSLLDGGFSAWRAAGGALESGEVVFTREVTPELDPQPQLMLDAAGVQAGLADQSILLLDARDGERFAGRVEPIDPVAGHVPGAANRPCSENLDGQGCFREDAQLGPSLQRSLDGRTPASVVHMCGSGVTACHNLFAMEQAGLPGSRLYVGSWSEWIRDSKRPIGTES